MVIKVKIIRDFESEFYTKKNRLLGNCFTIIDNDNKYYYEFCINNTTAIIKADNLECITDAVSEFRKYNSYINIFKTLDNSYYEEFDPVFTFKLPVNVIQPSKFFIDKDKVDIIENYMESDNIYISVAIINDEYVLLDGHHRLYTMIQNYDKLVNVYISNYDYYINDFIYIAKEQNIFNVKSMPVLSHDEYDKYWNGFLSDYFKNI